MDQLWVSSLLADRESESSLLDYKQTVPARDDKSTKAFLTDVAALANARGGRIVYGIAEDGQGRAKKLVPIEGNADQHAVWMQSKILRALVPRPRGVVVQPVHLSEGAVIVVDVPSQYAGPYQVEVGDWRVFPIRAGVRNTEMSYQQLFDAFSLRASTDSRIEAWIAARTSEVQEQASVVGGRRALVHLAPFSAFHADSAPDLSLLRDHPLKLSGSTLINRFNYRGMMVSTTGSGTRPSPPYFQFFRNGIVEICWSVSVFDGSDSLLQSRDTAIKLFDLVPQAARAAAMSGVTGPGLLSMSYVNVSQQSLLIPGDDGLDYNTHSNDERVLSFGPVLYDSLDLSVEEMSPIVSDFMNDLFRSFAVDYCPFFESDGTIKSQTLLRYVTDYRRAWQP